MALDETHVYWTTQRGGEVIRALKDGTDTEVLASEQGNPDGITVDGTHAYWTSRDDQQVMRLRLCCVQGA